MACAALQSLAILHHSLDGVGVECASKALCLALHTLHHRHCHVLLGEVGIHLQHLLCALLGLLACGMGGVSLLPQELAGAQEESCAHLPTHHVAPLVHQQGQVAIGMNPVLEGVPDDGLRGGTYDELLFQLGRRIHHHAVMRLVGLQSVVCHHRTLLGETFHVLGFLRQETLGDEQGEVGVLHACGLEHVVQSALHLLPDSVAVGLDDHTAAHVRLLGQVGFHHQFVVPLAIVLASFGEEFQFFCHYDVCVMLCLCLGNIVCERRYPIGIEFQYVCKITKKSLKDSSEP